MYKFRDVVVPSEPSASRDDKFKRCSPMSKPKHSETLSENVPSIEDDSEFPALMGGVARNSKTSSKPASEVGSVTPKEFRKKKIKKSTPLRVDICEIIQVFALKKEIKCKITSLKKSGKIKRKIISGNRLDGDQPKRHKGKERPWKPKDLSKTKKIICASRKIRLKRIHFTKEALFFKENLGNALKTGNVDVNDLVQDLSLLQLNVSVSSLHGDTSWKIAKDIIHNKKFRSYCNNLVTPELKQKCCELVTMLRKFQDRLHAKDEIKAHAKRRYVCGFNESKKFLMADKVKLLLVASDLEMEEGVPSMEVLKKLTDAADEKNIPIIYAGLRHNIGYWTLKKGKISVLAILNYEGANEVHTNLMKSWVEAKTAYDKLVQSIIDQSSEKATTEEVKKDEINETILNKLKEIIVTE